MGAAVAAFLALAACEEMTEVEGTDAPAAPESEPDPNIELALADDRDILLAAQHVLNGPQGLGWDANLPMDEWEGIGFCQPEYSDACSAGNPSKIYYLDLGYRDLTGKIPASLGNLSKLYSLGLSGNDLIGEIPTSLGSLSELQQLELSGNELTGNVPSSLGKLSKLSSLSLGFNDLTGEIPASLGNLSELYSLSLRYNDLSGEIPASFGKLSKLEFMDIDGSGLSGCIPTPLRRTLNSGVSDLDYYAFCDDVPDPLPEPASAFDIDLHFLGLTAAAIGRSSVNGRSSGRVSVVQDEIERAATWWETQLTGDIANAALSSSHCGRSVEWFIGGGRTIDDLAVIVEIGTDAPRNGGRAFVCQIRTASGLPVLARIVVHRDWLRGIGENYAFEGPGRIERLMRHELGHALGFTREVFAAVGLLQVANGHWRFTGSTARAWFPRTNLSWPLDDVQEYGVPLASDESHLPFSKQLMSARAPWEETTLTLAMMADLGYLVPSVAAQQYGG